MDPPTFVIYLNNTLGVNRDVNYHYNSVRKMASQGEDMVGDATKEYPQIISMAVLQVCLFSRIHNYNDNHSY